ncbi:protein TIC 22-like, chloroplastic [Prunus avium]|uniref:Protein TIC 22-like, chloroplastic n=1 Tax=Prunus avium TaxID=42229 RepID=A0A6P5U437_PRUAV|nr:protein TIC 22-like, chloroplastic [Prunus avium]
MNLGNSKNPKISSPPKHNPLELSLQQAFTNIQNHCSGFLHHLSHFPVFNPNPSSLKTQLESTFANLQNQAKHVFHTGLSSSVPEHSSGKTPVWARIAVNNKTQTTNSPGNGSKAAMSTEAIEERLAGVPVYALSNAAEEFVLVSGASSGKSLGLFCFKKEDAEALLEHIRIMDPGMRSGSKVVAVALNKVFQLKVDGVAFRLIPEYSQVKNALKEKEKVGTSDDDGFSGVPVFQSRSLILRSQSKSYRPVFFRKEDLESSLSRASREQNQLNPAFRPGDVQVAVLEEVIKGMKEGSTSTWDDVVFIPPGFDISTDPTKQ